MFRDLLLSFGATNTAAGVAPIIVSVTDDGNADSATVAVTGDGLIQLYYRVQGDSAWITGNTRTNSGDIVQTGLTTPNWYEFYATAAPSGVESAPSNVVTAYIAGVSTVTIEEALVEILLNDATVNSLVGNRIKPNYIPQNMAMPAVTYQEIDSPRDHTMDGPSGFVPARWQLNCWGTTYDSTSDVAEAIRQAYDGFSGTVGNVVIQAITDEGHSDMPNLNAGNDQLRRLGKRQDFNVYYTENTA